jgi:two-component system, cell cycle sensor histidine kinase and response regulator CckA
VIESPCEPTIVTLPISMFGIVDMVVGEFAQAHPSEPFTHSSAALLAILAGGLLLKTRAEARRCKQLEADLEQSEARLNRAQRLASLGHWEMMFHTGRGYWSDEVYRIFGLDRSGFELTRESFYRRVHPDDRERVRAAAEETIVTGKPYAVEHRIVRPDGSVRNVQEHGALVRALNGTGDLLAGTVQDVTEYRELEEQFRQAQKLESVGRLAGGIAHDFNNLLTVINGYAELSLSGIGSDDPLHPNLLEIRKAGQAAAGLTRQLLLFSRKDVVQPVVIDVNSIIVDSGKMLRRLIGEDIELDTALDPELGHTLADPGYFQQVLMNLAVNARDAMPHGGKLTIQTRNVILESTDGPNPPGPYVAVTVRDTGSGMDEKTKARLFEPFFTTKPLGKGTGLGLATVYGIVRQAQGSIAVESSPGQGTEFTLYFPRTRPAAQEQAPGEQSLRAPRGRASVLVVEDEDEVRSLTVAILERYGYTAKGAATAKQALEICREPGALDLIITDLVLPGMSGRDFAERAQSLRPSAKVLFTSGYSEDFLVERGLLASGISGYLQKPVPAAVLLGRIREALDPHGTSAQA